MTHRDDCAVIVRQLWPFLDGALPDSWRERVVEHLAACVECRSHFDFERAFLVAVRSAGHDGGIDTEALHSRVLAALHAHGFSAPWASTT
jgi:anti-sigma factor (TIGR02949 family)